MAPRVGHRAEQSLRLGKLRAGASILNLPGRARELPRPAAENLLRRSRLAIADRAQEDAHAGATILLPWRRLADKSDEVVEVGALDGGCDAVGECSHAEAPVRVLGGAHR